MTTLSLLALVAGGVALAGCSPEKGLRTTATSGDAQASLMNADDAGSPSVTPAPAPTPSTFAEIRYDERMVAADDEVLGLLLARANRAESADAFVEKEKVTFLNSEYVSYEWHVDGTPVEGVLARIYRDRAQGRVLKAEIDFPAQDRVPDEVVVREFVGVSRAVESDGGSRNAGALSGKETLDLYDAVGRAMGSDTPRPYKLSPIATVWRGASRVHRIIAEDARGKHAFEFAAGEGARNPVRKFKPHPSADAAAAPAPATLPPQPVRVFRDEGAIDTSYLDKMANPPPPDEPTLVPSFLTDLRAETNLIHFGRLLDALGSPWLRESKRVDGMPTLDEKRRGAWSELSHPHLFGPFDPRADGRRVGNSDFLGRPVRLDGRYVSVLLAPRAPVDLFGRKHGYAFAPFLSRDWEYEPATGDSLYKTQPYFWGRSLSDLPLSQRSPLAKGAPGPSETARLVEQGFDEVQVYHAVNALLGTARTWGFRDLGLPRPGAFREALPCHDLFHRPVAPRQRIQRRR